MEAFNDIFMDCTSLGTKIPKEDYLVNGKHIVVDQGQNVIAGYTDLDDGLFEDVPAIIFGDHTRVIKYVDEPFFLGADGVKLLKSKKQDANYKYLYYALKNARIPDTGYNRHFKWLKEVSIEYPNIDRQQEIVEVLDKITKIIEERKLELLQLDGLIKARFVEMFGNIQSEEKFESVPLRNLCRTMSGGTPSTKYPEYYKGDIPWISTVSLGPNHIDGSTAKGFITREAIDNSATKLIPAGNILFGTRVGVGKSSINDVDICTNQDIVAIVGIDKTKFNRLFIKHVLDYYQPYYNSIKKGATILGITGDDLKDTLIPSAPIELQLEFEQFVEKIDKSKVVVQKALDEAQLLFDSLMQEYFG